MKNLTYKNTLYACYLGYITQAIVVNLSPIFFVIFKDSYGLTNTQIGTVVFVLFALQLFIDLASAWFVDRIGFRRCAIVAHIAAASGLVLLGILPRVLDSYTGIMISVVISAVGSGLIEVLISPIVDLLPADSKASAMSLLHAFYCWGQVAVVAFSTIILALIGDGLWYIIPFLWAIIPVTDAVFFSFVPIPEPVQGEAAVSPGKLVRSKVFVLAALVMFAAAMGELSMSQWASYFAERGLEIPKVAGDLLGPCMFGIFMAIGRTVYGIYGAKWSLSRVLTGCALICAAGYFITVFSPVPAISLAGCGITGFGVSLLWPGTLSLTSEKIPGGGTSLFALLALFGDLGCSVGPWLTGVVSETVTRVSVFENIAQATGISEEQISLKAGLLVIALFPLAAAFVIRNLANENKRNN